MLLKHKMPSKYFIPGQKFPVMSILTNARIALNFCSLPHSYWCAWWETNSLQLEFVISSLLNSISWGLGMVRQPCYAPVSLVPARTLRWRLCSSGQRLPAHACTCDALRKPLQHRRTFMCLSVITELAEHVIQLLISTGNLQYTCVHEPM